MNKLPKRSKSRLTKEGMIYERRIIALRRLQARNQRQLGHAPTESETEEAKTRWQALRHRLM